MVFSPPEYCRLFPQKKAYQAGVTGTPGPPLATPLHKVHFYYQDKRQTEKEKRKMYVNVSYYNTR